MVDRVCGRTGATGNRARVCGRVAGDGASWVWGDEFMGGYAGDIEPEAAWTLMREEGGLLVDVRTPPEWSFVGQVDATGIAGGAGDPVLLPWQDYPSMQVNPAFADQLEAELDRRGLGRDVPLAFLCRSGVRSLAAANAMAGRGYGRAYNIAGGFEGVPDGDGHRGRVNGWKVAGLPWRQG